MRAIRKEDASDALASFDPPEEEGDVHSACTAVAVLPDSFLDDLRRAKAEEPTTSRYKVLPESDLVGNEAPTLPPPPRRDRVRELNATISAALEAAAAPALDMSPFLARPTPVPTVQPTPSVAPVRAIPIVTIDLVPTTPHRPTPWIDVALGMAFVLALLLSAGTIVLAFSR